MIYESMFIVEGLVQEKGTFTKVNVKFFDKSDKIGLQMLLQIFTI